MSKKDYILIATVLNSEKRVDSEGAWLFANIVNKFCNQLEADNPRFKPEEFKRMCYA